MKICYIYAIRNIITEQRYVGSTINLIHRRSAHFRNLELKKHQNPKLQNSYNKYGKENFIFEILESFDFSSKDFLFEREQHYMDFYKCCKEGFNIVTNAAFNQHNSLYNEEKRKLGHEKLSQTLKGKTPKNFVEMQKMNWKPLLEFENGIFVREYKTIKEAGQFLEVDDRLIGNTLRGITKKVKKYPNKTWKIKKIL